MFVSKCSIYFGFLVSLAVILFSSVINCHTESYSHAQIENYRLRVIRMFEHAYNGYLNHAYPYDELRPLSCDGHDTWGSYSLTLIDALSTLVVMGNHSEFRRVAKLLESSLDFDRDINVSVFETNIRVVGGLLSAHLLSHRAQYDLEVGWPCTGPLLRLAEAVARKLLPAFNTSTGMPYGTVNLRYGVPIGETPVTCTAGVGTFLIEFGTLSKLTGDEVFENVALRAINSLHALRSTIGLVGNHIDVQSGRWTAQDAGIGAGVDSYFEYLVKGGIMFNYPRLINMFNEYRTALELYNKRDDWFLWSQMQKGSITQPVFQSLEAFWPGMLSLLGDVSSAMKTFLNYHHIWRQFGFMPEFYNIPQADTQNGRESYPLRPEFIESTMYLYRMTQDQYLLSVGADVLESLEHNARTDCGYATIKNVRDHTLENRMESFFLSETTKYLYLLFDTNNFIHNTGSSGFLVTLPDRECVIDSGGYIFNTEAHPFDLAAIQCCSAETLEQDQLIRAYNSKASLASLVVDDDELMLARKRRKNSRGKQDGLDSHVAEKCQNDENSNVNQEQDFNMAANCDKNSQQDPEVIKNCDKNDESHKYEGSIDSVISSRSYPRVPSAGRGDSENTAGLGNSGNTAGIADSVNSAGREESLNTAGTGEIISTELNDENKELSEQVTEEISDQVKMTDAVENSAVDSITEEDLLTEPSLNKSVFDTNEDIELKKEDGNLSEGGNTSEVTTQEETTSTTLIGNTTIDESWRFLRERGNLTRIHFCSAVEFHERFAQLGEVLIDKKIRTV